MPEYLAPGVYVEEIDRGPKPIEAAGTALPIFVGFTEKAQVTKDIGGENLIEDVLGQPQLITSWTQFSETFGGFVEGAFLPTSVFGYFMNGGSRCYVSSVRTIPKAQALLLNSKGKPQLALQAKSAGFGGLRMRAKVEVPEAPTKAPAKKDDKEATPAPESSTEPAPFTLTIETQQTSGEWKVKEVIRDIALAEQEDEMGRKRIAIEYRKNKPRYVVILLPAVTDIPLEQLWPRTQEQAFTIDKNVLAPPVASEFQGSAMESNGIAGLEKLQDATMLVVPDLMTPMPGQKELDLNTIKAVQTMMIAHCEKMGDRVAILDAPPNMRPKEVNDWRVDTTGYDSSSAVLYYPWIEVSDPITNRPTLIPPSGYIAGVWARSDSERGVHKAPANETIRGATGLGYYISRGEQDVLNPNAVNCLRFFAGAGIKVWGARTLSSNPSWKYINTRRFFNMVEKSIEQATQWTVFEPNDPGLWGQIVRDVSAFLTTQWRLGALFGASPAEAFFVKCDAENNTQETRDLGQLHVDVGMATVKPAEFVIFRISQWAP